MARYKERSREPDYPPGLWVNSAEEDSLRWLPSEPSPQIIDLFHLTQGKIFDQAPGRLCYASSLNFCATLFYALKHEKFLRQIKKYSQLSKRDFSLTGELAYPFRVLRDVPLFIYSKEDFGYDPAPFRAPLVLFKRVSGEDAGVVISGPLTGLILDTCDDFTQPHNGMTVNRVWNDERMVNSDAPSEPPYYREDQFGYDWPKLDSHYNLAFASYLQINKLRPPVWTTTLFFHLAKKIGLPVDEQNFHYTRSKSDWRSALLSRRRTR